MFHKTTSSENFQRELLTTIKFLSKHVEQKQLWKKEDDPSRL